MNTVAIILARGGSKGLPGKNIIDFCGKPLIAWTIENCLEGGVNNVYVSSDSDQILKVAELFGAVSVKRPEAISGDYATSEIGWEHCLDIIEKQNNAKPDWIIAPQVTSPLRTRKDIEKAIDIARSGNFDSLFSCSITEDLLYWHKKNNTFESVNYDWARRKRRQDIPVQYIENGSFYMFRPEVLRKYKNRFGGRIGVVEMDFWQLFEIDSALDLRMCAALMKEFIIKC